MATSTFSEPVLRSIDEARTSDARRRVVVVAPGGAAAAELQGSIARAGLNGVAIVGPDALVSAMLPVGWEISGPRIRTLTFWLDTVRSSHERWSRRRCEERAEELFAADLAGQNPDHLAESLSAETVGESVGLIEFLGPDTPAVVLFGFATEDQRVDLPASLAVVIESLRRCEVTVVEAHAPTANEADERSQQLFISPDRLSEVLAVADSIGREALGDVAVVVPDDGPYEESFAAALESRGIAVHVGRARQIGETTVGRWLSGFLQAASDSFARPLMVDLLHQLAVAQIVEVDAVTELDRLSRTDWVLDNRHWWALAGSDRVDPAVADALRVLLTAGTSLSTSEADRLDDLYQLVGAMDPEGFLRRFRPRGETVTNRAMVRKLLSTRVPSVRTEGLQVIRLSEAFGLAQPTVFVVGFDTTATYRSSQSAADISLFKAKRRSWVWLTSYTPQLIVTAPAADLAAGDRLEVSAWARTLGDPSWLPPAASLRSTMPGTTASIRQVDWLRDGPQRSLGADLTGHRWSPSQVDTFQRCPLQWMLKSRFRLPRQKTPESDTVLDPATRGTIVHQVLEDRAGADRSFEQLLREAIAEHVSENALRDGDPLIEVTIRDLAARIQQGHREIETELGLSEGDEQHEAVVTTELVCGERRVAFTGKIDRIIDADESRLVLDYKSSKRITKSGDLSSAPASGEHLQLWLYASMLEAIGEKTADEIALAFPLADLKGRDTRVQRISIGGRSKHRQQVLEGIERVVAQAEAADLAVAQQGWESPCRYCDVADACPARHRGGPAHDRSALFGVRR